MNKLAEEYQVSSPDMVKLLSASLEDYEVFEGFPNYEQHKVSGVIRNRNTRRILKPNAVGQVRLRNGTESKWVMQAKGVK
ncbi:hypothetical protein BCT64_11495 [Vibrio breoganii]|nr:hypothetical protein BCT64_11495 [Vibrio breoganii]PMN65790.1 hypothetical protein BCT28_06090 [Vibrio breoganii]